MAGDWVFCGFFWSFSQTIYYHKELILDELVQNSYSSGGQTEKQIKQTGKPRSDLCIWNFTASKIRLLALIFVTYGFKDDSETNLDGKRWRLYSAKSVLKYLKMQISMHLLMRFLFLKTR